MLALQVITWSVAVPALLSRRHVLSLDRLNVGAHPRRLRRGYDAGGIGCSAGLAGLFEKRNPFL
jgi:hypothetical protein